ncbi:MAG: Hsp20/alpha crystallin family protein [Candidatus Bipolaricaulis anaerobius]|jgi:HSP20 family protein|uniref:Heat shock protein Hsp20 n=1 Tax=Candidatus Bipolaricaulis anaerobius TaxID=2026885 RepID=A0A2X3L2G5_9BACT|nr:Hsp20/alpha crystallin family protein [Candidatus Bipolaricaulis anaerobius]MBP7726352.1 Hsp20/alpha crystallin family protein [Candidatus Bipolaricaulis sp.]MDD2912695.1 Hsp20/alpha crystallin family protein [Candidatus Bipolaricaulis anaerobius]MDD3747934.1 Hsp20/alpha crystallin family protein [Candidatus Bipolaricaulis anaerobius]MDD5764077.1 Hsp20/alpha crystallin family protein [Candidatus Bipolaricaulis anaerobius]SQD93339.1 Heat shock protein Hsp20 [Candidatus Bipolaricaulis anaerob
MARLPMLWQDPFAITSRIGQVMDELLRDFGTFPDLELAPAFGQTDIYVKDKHLVVETELPGATKDDVQVKVEGDRLVITGEVKRSEEVRDENYIRMGRRYGAFRRVFPLPKEAEDKKGIKARFENGVLIVEVPLKRAPEAEGVFDVKVE